MTVRFGWVLFLAIGMAAPASAQEVAKDRRRLRDDRSDRARIIDIARDWQLAVSRKDGAAERASDARLKLWLTEELGESVREAGQAGREASRSHVERNQSRREAVGPGVKDQHDLRDDRRDLRDDRRDAAVAGAEALTTRSIAFQLRDLQPAFDSGRANALQYGQKKELLEKLVAQQQREVQRDKREVREDLGERREDRRERREDRR